MADILAQAIFHALFASIFVEALVRSWRVREPGQRIALRLVALGYPLVLFPLLVALPIRWADAFQEGWALLVGRRWDDVRLLGTSVFRLWVGTFAALGAVLFLMDLVPLLRQRRRPRLVAAEPDPGSAVRLAASVARIAGALGIAPPRIVFLDRAAPALFCTGVRRRAVVVSRGALELLDDDELRAALAHELAHLARHDPGASWILMAGRALLFFNPAFQVVSRAVARDAEWLADDRAAVACGDRVALASGLLKLFRATGGSSAERRTLPFAAALSEPLARVRSLDVEVRCRRLLAPAPERLPFGAARVVLTTLALTGVLFFVI